jgi:hypothetical protein
MEQHPNWANLGSPLKYFLLNILELRHYGSLSFSFYENDSKDNTASRLTEWGRARHEKNTIICETLGKPRYRSLPADKGPERLQLYAEMRNRTLEAYDGEDWVLFLEPDIVYNPQTLLYLLQDGPGDIRSPLSFSHAHNLFSFYDPLSTRDMAGTKYQWAWPPANTPEDRLSILRGQPLEVSSTFNCFCLISGAVIQAGVRFSIAGEGHSEASSFCQSAREKGFKVYLFPSVRYSVIHPLAQQPWSENS